MAVIAVSWLTFSLPKEFFDPHPGIRTDIFCKTLTFLGAEVPGEPGVFLGGPVFEKRQGDSLPGMRCETSAVSNAIRAPPYDFAA